MWCLNIWINTHEFTIHKMYLLPHFWSSRGFILVGKLQCTQYYTFSVSVCMVEFNVVFIWMFCECFMIMWSHLFPVSFSLDERDKIQKKTFTKWINKHLRKVNHFLLSYVFKLSYLYDLKSSRTLLYYLLKLFVLRLIRSGTWGGWGRCPLWFGKMFNDHNFY